MTGTARPAGGAWGYTPSAGWCPLPDDLFRDLRGSDGWTLELEALAVLASEIGRLQEAYDAAVARFFAAMGGRSLSSRTVVAVYKAGILRNPRAFLALLRLELLTVLGRAGFRDVEPS